MTQHHHHLTPPRLQVATNTQKSLAGVVGVGAAALLMVFVPKFEGTVFRSYRDPIGILTSCTGHVGPDIAPGQVFTKAECAELLDKDLVKHAEGAMACVKVPVSDGEKAAYVSFAFNVGTAAWCGSTANRLLNGGNHAGACAQLSLWVYAGGKQLSGLVNRRATERALCEGKIAA